MPSLENYLPTCKVSFTNRTCARGAETFPCGRLPDAHAGAARPDVRSGAWRLKAGYTYYLDRGLVGGLARLFGSDASVTEFGAGSGCYTNALATAGVRIAAAFDGVPGIGQLTRGLVAHADLSQRGEGRLVRSAWVLALEIAEHIPPERESAFLANVDAHAADAVVLSWSSTVMGNGHLNARPSWYVRYRMAALGLLVDAAASHALRKSVCCIPWYRDDVLVFRRNATAAADAHAKWHAEMVRAAQPRVPWEPSSDTYRVHAGPIFNDFRRCGNCCGAPFDCDLEPGGASPMCRGSDHYGGLFNISISEAEERCTADASCAGFWVFNPYSTAGADGTPTGRLARPVPPQWLRKAGLLRHEVRPVTRMPAVTPAVPASREAHGSRPDRAAPATARRWAPRTSGWTGYERVRAKRALPIMATQGLVRR